MAGWSRSIIAASGALGLVASLVLLFQTRANRRARDEQAERLRAPIAQLEVDAKRCSSANLLNLPPDELEAYLSTGYKEFDATPGSGHRRFRDPPRDPGQATALIEALAGEPGVSIADARPATEGGVPTDCIWLEPRLAAAVQRFAASTAASAWHPSASPPASNWRDSAARSIGSDRVSVGNRVSYSTTRLSRWMTSS